MYKNLSEIEAHKQGYDLNQLLQIAFVSYCVSPQEQLFQSTVFPYFTKVVTPVHSRSSHQRCSIKKGVLRNFTKFTGKHLCKSLFFNKVAGLRNRLWHRYFPVNFVIFLRTPFFTEHLWCLLLPFLRDTLKAFDDFKNKQQNCMK